MAVTGAGGGIFFISASAGVGLASGQVQWTPLLPLVQQLHAEREDPELTTLPT